jgi:hypothetical protein
MKTYGHQFPDCGAFIVAPILSEFRATNELRHRWQCESCGEGFDTLCPRDGGPAPELTEGIHADFGRGDWTGQKSGRSNEIVAATPNGLKGTFSFNRCG